MRRPLISALLLAASAALPLAGAAAQQVDPDYVWQPGRDAAGPSDELFGKLAAAPSRSEASQVAQDILLGLRESGSAAADLMLSRGIELQAENKFADARAHYDRAIALAPDFAEAWNRRAALSLQEGDVVAALRDLNEVLRSEPRHFTAWAGLGYILETLGGPEEAMRAYRRALSLYSHMEGARRGVERVREEAEGLPL